MMQALANAAMLALWERGRHRGPVERALMLLGAALSGHGRGRIARRSPSASAMPPCWRCGGRRSGAGSRVRSTARAAASRSNSSSMPARLPAPTAAPREIMLADGLRLRLPNSRDLIAAGRCATTEDAAQMLLRAVLPRCRAGAARAGCDPRRGRAARWRRCRTRPISSSASPALPAATCGRAHFDICGYFWEEIEQRAAGLLDDVHRLARLYGWERAAHPRDERRAPRRLSRAVRRMSGYLHTLAARARGLPAAIRPPPQPGRRRAASLLRRRQRQPSKGSIRRLRQAGDPRGRTAAGRRGRRRGRRTACGAAGSAGAIRRRAQRTGA